VIYEGREKRELRRVLEVYPGGILYRLVRMLTAVAYWADDDDEDYCGCIGGCVWMCYVEGERGRVIAFSCTFKGREHVYPLFVMWRRWVMWTELNGRARTNAKND
jgi:hypothetical protein